MRVKRLGLNTWARGAGHFTAATAPRFVKTSTSEVPYGSSSSRYERNFTADAATARELTAKMTGTLRQMSANKRCDLALRDTAFGRLLSAGFHLAR